MTTYENLTKIVLATAFALSVGSCDNKARGTIEEDIVIYGTPISVSSGYGDYKFTRLSIVLNVDNQCVLAFNHHEIGEGISRNVAIDAQALILAEINDNDSEKVELSGKYVGNKFEITKLKANKYELNFK